MEGGGAHVKRRRQRRELYIDGEAASSESETDAVGRGGSGEEVAIVAESLD